MDDASSDAKRANDHHRSEAEEALDEVKRQERDDPLTQAFAEAMQGSEESLMQKAAATASYQHASGDEEYSRDLTVKENAGPTLEEVGNVATQLDLSSAETQLLFQQIYGSQADAMVDRRTVNGFDVTDVTDTGPATAFRDNDYDTEKTYELHDALGGGVVTPGEYQALVSEHGPEFNPLEASKDEIAEAYLDQGLYEGEGGAHSRAASQVRVYTAVNELLTE